MELEFDKEIDAILRKSQDGLAVATTGGHLDADAVAAFAEGAIPERSRPLYTRHLADCDGCRKLLSQAITMNTAAISAADEAASSVVAPVAESSSWLSNLFRTPNLALAMGALVLTFSGVLGYLVLRNQQSETAMVSQSETEMQKGGPSAGIEANETLANSSAATQTANAAANSAESNVPATSEVAKSATAGATTNSVTTRSFDDLPGTGRDADKPMSPDGFIRPEPKSEAAPPPAPAAEKSVAERDREKLKTADKEIKDENVLLGGVRQDTEDRRSSGDVSLAKKKQPGPARSGPVQSQNQINTQTYEMPVTRVAGGKKFTNRGGAWYDTAYRGQTTVNIRRGTDEYKKLDSGLRSIAETLGGVVVVVWKDKAYRVQ